MADLTNIKAQLESKGVSTAALSDDEVVAVAKAFKIKTPRKVEVIEHTNKAKRKALYVVSEGFPYQGDDGKEHSARNLFVPAVPEVLRQMIDDLEQGLALLKNVK